MTKLARYKVNIFTRQWNIMYLIINRSSTMGFMLPALLFFAQSFAYAEENFLEPEAAFAFSARMVTPKTVEITFVIADGYYMYRDRFRFSATDATLGEVVLPPGKIKFDDTFQKSVETYRNKLIITVPVEARQLFTLKAASQGCADKGLCYAPMESVARLNPVQVITSVGAVSGGSKIFPPSSAESVTNSGAPQIGNVGITLNNNPELGKIEAALKSGQLLVILPLFVLLGLGLSFTPCVLPMVPILSFIIVGEGVQVRKGRGFILALTYSLGMAIVYTLLGIAAGLIGEGLSAALQSPWVLSIFALLMVVLSLPMFDVYQLQMPASIQQKLLKFSERQTAGKLFGVFAMGAISALIVGPCVAAPLAATLLYISQTRNVVVGGSALFFLAAGMSVPLLLVGISGGALLPRAGAWMEAVKRFFGVLMLAIALWMIRPFLSPFYQLSGWAVLGIGYAVYLLRAKKVGWISRSLGLLFAAFGLIQFAGAVSGAQDVFSPLAYWNQKESSKTGFVRVRSVAELDAALAPARGKIVMLDFYADWCVACKEMEKFTFSDPRVQAQFANMLLLQVDVTANNADDKTLLKKFNLFGPPGIIFFDKQGKEIPGGRVIGYQKPEQFLQSLSLVNQF